MDTAGGSEGKSVNIALVNTGSKGGGSKGGTENESLDSADLLSPCGSVSA